jgi:hypothetical protein
MLRSAETRISSSYGDLFSQQEYRGGPRHSLAYCGRYSGRTERLWRVAARTFIFKFDEFCQQSPRSSARWPMPSSRICHHGVASLAERLDLTEFDPGPIRALICVGSCDVFHRAHGSLIILCFISCFP